MNKPESFIKRTKVYINTSLKYNFERYKEFVHYNGKRINSYCSIYHIMLHDIDEETSLKMIEEYKSNKATSKTNFIKKYGEAEGTKKWDEFFEKTLCEKTRRCRYIEKYGKEIGEMLHNLYMKITNIRCIEYYLTNYETTLEEATEMQLEYQKYNSGLFKEYYISRNLEIKDHSRKKGRTPTSEVCRKRLITKFENGKCSHPDDVCEWKKYKNRVANITRKQEIQFLNNYDLYNNDKNTYHLDHKVSIVHGFLNGIPEHIIGCIHNLEIILKTDNIKKSYRSSMEVEELIRKYNENRKNN